MEKKKTPDYTRRAVDKYHASIDRIMINAPKGTKERIQSATNKSISGFILELINNELERLENENN